MTSLSIIGCGFVADLYMRSLALYPDIKIAAVYDRDSARCTAFCSHWSLSGVASLKALFADTPKGSVILNLTNPSSHFEINKVCLEAGYHVYSEKPLAVDMDQATALHTLATKRNLLLASAPCSVLGEAAQTLGAAIRADMAGCPRLIYAELDDGFIPQAPHGNWISDSGAPWPVKDEFEVGCTLEHAGYYLSWLIGFFGPVLTVVAASAEVIPNKTQSGNCAPDFSVATLFFESGLVARLTCSIVAPHDHQIRVIGDKGVLRVEKAWDNSAKVSLHRRIKIRRRLLESPLAKRFRLKGPTHPKVTRKGAAAMNFALGPVEMIAALKENRPCRLSSDFALHMNEVTLAIQNSGETTGAQQMQTTCPPIEPMPWAK
ncbi:MAG: Gfo/Idh/MocA family oxidoreductase [Rhodobacteraceae bacterium]|nr:Gfo/Idh/MocA family oxidoreductase [Paracoccaceae bacterium]